MQFGMFTTSGDSAVREALTQALHQFGEDHISEQSMADLIYEVQCRVSRQGFSEAFDTAVREAIWGAVGESHRRQTIVRYIATAR